MLDIEIDSHYLNETMILKIYKPESFSTLHKYNFCIMQDGNDYFQLGRAATVSDKLHSNDEILKTIFIGIHYRDKYDRRKKYHPNGEQQQSYSKFLAHEVVPFLDKTFPTPRLGSSRVLIGDSLAGTLALMTSLRYPHTFGKVIMQSPYVDDAVIQMLKTTKDLHLIDIYHTIGVDETEVMTTDGSTIDFVTPNRELNKLLVDKDIRYEYNELDPGRHTWKYWQKDLPRALVSMLN